LSHFTHIQRGLGTAAAALLCVLPLVAGTLPVTISPSTVAVGVANTPYSQQLTAGDGSYTWSFVVGQQAPPSWLHIDPATGKLTGTPTAAGIYQFTVQVNDVVGAAGIRQYDLLVNLPGTVLTEGLPSGMAIVNISATSTTPSVGGNGSQPVDQSQNQWRQPFNTAQQLLEYTMQPGTYTMRVINPADAVALFPSLDGKQDLIWTAWSYNSPYITDFLVFDSSAASDSQQSQLFSVAGLSPGAADAATAYSDAVNGYTDGNSNNVPPFLNAIALGSRDATPQTTVTFPLVGTEQENVIFTVADNELSDNHAGVSVLIAPATSAPSISNLCAGNGQVNAVYPTVNLNVGGGSGTYWWSATGLPPGLTLSATGSPATLTGTPTTAGSYDAQITVTDPVSGLRETRSFPIFIAPSAPPLSIAELNVPRADPNGNYSYTLTATGGDGSYSWSLSGTAPLQIDTATGTLTASQLPASGTYPFDVTVQDLSGSSYTASYTLVVAAPISISPGLLPSAVTGSPYSQQLSAAGGSGNYSWSITDQSSGLNMSLSGSSGTSVFVEGIPTQTTSEGGLSLEVELTDVTTGESTQQFYYIDVRAGLPSGLTAYILSFDGSIASFTGSQATLLAEGNSCYYYSGCYDMARDKSGNLVVAAGYDGLYIYNPTGGHTTIGTADSGQEQISSYSSVAVDAQGDYIVADNGRNQILRISHTGEHAVVQTIPYSPRNPDEHDAYYDAYVRVDSSGNYILLEDSQPDNLVGNSLQPHEVFFTEPIALHQFSPDGTLNTTVPITTEDCIQAPVLTRGFTFDANGNYVTVDPFSLTVYTVGKAGATGAGKATILFSDDGELVNDPTGITRDPASGRYYMADNSDEALVSFAADGSDFRVITQENQFLEEAASVVLVNGVPSGATDYVLHEDLTITGIGANSVTLPCDNEPVCIGSGSDLAIDTAGDFVMATYQGLIRMTLAGTPTLISQPDGQNSAWSSVAVDAAGNYIVADGRLHRITRMSSTGTNPVSFSYGDYSGDEDAWVRIDSQGNYIVAEDNAGGNSEVPGPVHIHKITPAGVRTDLTLTGDIPQSASGLTIDASGNYIVSDRWSGTVFSITPAGVATDLFSAYDDSPFYNAAGVAREAATGKILIADYDYESNGKVFSVNADGTGFTLVGDGLDTPVAVVSASFGIVTTSLPPATAGAAYSPVTLTAWGGTTPYTWQATGLPAGMTVSQTGVLSGLPSAGGTFPVHLTVSDSASHTATADLSLLVSGGTTPPPPPALSIVTPLIPAGTTGIPYGPVTLSATGGNGTYLWSMTGAPAGLNLTSSGILSGTPAVSGTFIVRVAVTSGGLFAQQNYSLSVALGPLTIEGPSSLGGFASGTPIDTAWTAAGGTGPYQWSAVGLPAGLALDAAGHLTGAIAQPGNYSFAVQVTDSKPVTTSLNVSAFVLGINASSLPDASNNIAYSQTLTALGGAAPYTWALHGTLPAGLSLSNSGVLSGTPVLDGSPTEPQTFSIPVSVTSGGVTASKDLSLTVALAPQPLSIPGAGFDPIALPEGSFETPYSEVLQAAGGIPPYSWTYLAGTLPDGLALDSSGTISGLPVKSSIFAFTAQVRDSAGAAVAAGFSIRIHANPVQITNGVLPQAIVGTAYPDQTFGAAGGLAPYTFAVQGSLPAGLTFANGSITGTPTSAGNSSFTVTVTDSSQPALTSSSEFRIAATPAHADLILSHTSASFSFSAGAAVLPFGPSTAFISVGANTPQTLGFTTSLLPAVSWVTVTAGGKTPNTIGISLDPSALALAAGVYKTSVVVTCTSASPGNNAPCAGTSQNIEVTLNVVAAPPRIVAEPATLTFFSQTSDPQTQQGALILENAGGGLITVNSVTAADNFVTLSGVPTTLAASGTAPVTVSVNSNGLSAGFHQASILVNTSAGSLVVPVTLLVSDGANMTLNPSGMQFHMVAGAAPGNANGSFSVYMGSKTNVSWEAAVLPEAPWLHVTDSSGQASATEPGTVHFTIDSTAAALAPNAYYGTIRVTSAGAVDTPQDFLVVLNVTPKTSLIQPDPEPGGLVFISDGNTALPPQTVNVYAGSSAPLSYSVQTDSPWLSAAAASGSASSGSPDTTRVSVNTGSLAPGIYRGGVSFQFTGSDVSTEVRTVNVTLIYKGAATVPAGHSGLRPLQVSSGCSATALVPTQTGLSNSFSQPAAWPTPLKVQVVDNCGRPVPHGQVIATFSNGDAPLALTAADATSGNYVGTWTPRNPASQITIAARASAPGFSPATIQIGGQVTPNAAPILTPDGTLNAFAPVLGATVAPGTIVQIYGSNLASQTAIASAIPLPVKMNSTAILIGGIPAPLYYVSPGQINAQVPFELPANKQYQVIVNANGALSTPIPLLVTANAPGIAGFATGQIIAQHLDGRLVLEDSPAAPGEIIVFYVAGMGLTNQDVASGEASPSTNLALPLDAPTVTLGDIPVTDILFAGLTPTLVGLYQVDFRVPETAPNGTLTLVLTQPNGQSNTTVLAVHN
jgi:uncharacterized protein (TIGR03437 family)